MCSPLRSKMRSVLAALEPATNADGAAAAAEAAEQANGLPEMADMPRSDGAPAPAAAKQTERSAGAGNDTAQPEAAEQPERTDGEGNDTVQLDSTASTATTIRESSAVNAVGAEVTAGVEGAAVVQAAVAAEEGTPAPSAAAEGAVVGSAPVAEVQRPAHALSARHET